MKWFLMRGFGKLAIASVLVPGPDPTEVNLLAAAPSSYTPERTAIDGPPADVAGPLPDHGAPWSALLPPSPTNSGAVPPRVVAMPIPIEPASGDLRRDRA